MDEYEKPLVFAQPFNQDFLTGKARRIKGASLADWLLSVFCLLVFIPAIAAYLTNAQLAANGVRINAEIIDKHQSEDDYFVTYRYVVDEQPYQREEEVRSADYRVRELGDEIPVRYLPNEPSVARLTDPYAASDVIPSWTFWLSLIFLVYAMLMTGGEEWLSFSFSRRGQLIDGVLDSVHTQHISRIGKEATFYYHFQSPRGKPITGERRLIRNDLRGFPPPAGSPVKVLYIDDDTHRML